jgi:hypothetical protein
MHPGVHVRIIPIGDTNPASGDTYTSKNAPKYGKKKNKIKIKKKEKIKIKKKEKKKYIFPFNITLLLLLFLHSTRCIPTKSEAVKYCQPKYALQDVIAYTTPAQQ